MEYTSQIDAVLNKAHRQHNKMPMFFCRKLKWQKRMNEKFERRRNVRHVDEG